MSRPWPVLTLFLCLAAAAAGQQAPAAPPATPAAPSANSQEEAVYEQLDTRVDFQNDGTGVVETVARIRVQSPAGVKDYGLLRFPYARSNATIDILYMRVRKPDGTVVETPLDTAQDIEAEISRVAPTYSDLREKHIAIRGLAPGDIIEYSSRENTTKPLAPGQFWFTFLPKRDAVTVQEQLTVTAPAERALLVRNGETAPTVRREAGRQIYSWKFQNASVKKKEKGDLEQLQEQALGVYPPYEVQLTTFRSWDELGKWIASLMTDRIQVTPEIQARVAQLTKGLTSDDKKIAAIYDFVSTQYRYINVSFGIGRYQPHTADEVFGYGYGDCKDKHTLLATMLKAAGIEAYPALISAYHSIDEKLPSPQQFDHMITYVPRPGGALWLDSTAEVAPAGTLVSVLRGKPALVIRPGAATLEHTPMNLPNPVHESFEGTAVLGSDGKLHAKVEWERQGDLGLQLRAAFRIVPANQWDQLAQRLSYLAGFAGKTSDLSVSSIEEIETPLKYSYAYDREGYAGWENGQTSPFMPRISLPDLPDTAKDTTAKKIDIYLGPLGEMVMHSKMTLPPGSDLFIPQTKVDLVESFGEYHATYSYKGSVLESTRRLVTKQNMVPAAQYDALRAFVKQIDDDQGQFLTLHASVHPLDTIFTNVEAAQQAVDRGVTAARQRQFQTAIEDFQKALALDPKIKGAWTAIAAAEAAQRNTDEAITAWHKEIELNPDWLPAYKQLGFELMTLSRFNEAADVWRKLQKAAPDDGDSFFNLGSALMQGKQYKEAAAELRVAVDKNPASAPMRRLYGTAAVKAGDRELGLAALAKAIELDPSAVTYNDAAWELADDNVELERAQEWARQAVHLAEERTRVINIDNLQKDDLVAIPSLGNIWDTLGWVYYRQGKLADAEQFLKAAWELTQSKPIGEHLVEVYEKEQKAERARWTRATVGRSAMPETLPLPWLIKGKNWSAEVFILLAPNGKNGAKAMGLHFLDKEKALPEVTTALMATDYDASLPPGSDARIVRKGVVYCGKNVGCTITLLLPKDVQDVE